VAATKAKNGGLAIRPHKLTAAASAAMAASAQAASNAQQQDEQHSDGQNQLGHGTPNSRPKKRLPSGKGKKSQGGDMPSQPDHIPPVPQIPDMHRGSSPGQGQGQHGTPTMMTLQPPYGIPSEHYGHGHPQHPHPHHPHHQQHQHQASPTQASFYPHSPGTAPPSDYGGYYGGHPGYLMHQQQGQGTPGQGQGTPGQGQGQGQQTPQSIGYGDSRQRMMMDGGRNLGMNYVGPGGHSGQDVQ
jgi:hypothetical protein